MKMNKGVIYLFILLLERMGNICIKCLAKGKAIKSMLAYPHSLSMIMSYVFMIIIPIEF